MEYDEGETKKEMASNEKHETRLHERDNDDCTDETRKDDCTEEIRTTHAETRLEAIQK